MQFISESPLAWITFQAKLIKDSASAAVQRRTQAIINRAGDTVARLEDRVGGQRGGSRGMWRMKRALASQDLLCRATEARSLVFHRALMCRAGSLGCCRIPELGFALQSLFIALLVCQEPGADTISFLTRLTIYRRKLHGAESRQQVSLAGL